MMHPQQRGFGYAPPAVAGQTPGGWTQGGPPMCAPHGQCYLTGPQHPAYGAYMVQAPCVGQHAGGPPWVGMAPLAGTGRLDGGSVLDQLLSTGTPSSRSPTPALHGGSGAVAAPCGGLAPSSAPQPPRPAAVGPAPAAAPQAGEPKDEAAVVNDPVLADWSAPSNEGSVGHPFLCSRPCLFVTSGSCASGNDCAFCHRSHPKRPLHLDKRNREMLDRMPDDARTALLLSLLQEKVAAIDTSPMSQKLFEAMAVACGSSPPAGFATEARPIKRRERTLQSALATMSLRPVLSILVRTTKTNIPQVNAAAEALWKHCRQAASAAEDGAPDE